MPTNLKKGDIKMSVWKDRTFWEKVVTILTFGLNLFWTKKK